MAVKILAMQAKPRTPEGKTRRLRSAVLWLCALSALSALSVFAQELPMKIRLHVNGATTAEIATATLVDNPTARDFAALLPLSLTLVDFAKVARIGDLPRKLSLQRPGPLKVRIERIAN
jgi:hypothetical protein